jgi:hypothetical protein
VLTLAPVSVMGGAGSATFVNGQLTNYSPPT